MASSPYTAFLMEDGTVKTVGNNQYGQLGNGSVKAYPYAEVNMQTLSLSNVKQVSCGGGHTVFLMEDGTVKAVGYNINGQLGNGSVKAYPYAEVNMQTLSLSNVKQVSCGYSHTVFLMEDGTVKTVGNSDHGQCGQGNTTNPQLDVLQIPNLSNVKQVSCGNSHTVFLMEDGTVRAVGQNNHGQCGQGNITSPQLEILEIPSLTGVKQISCGQYHTVFLMRNGTVRAVGYNQYGQCGQGNVTHPQLDVLEIPSLTGVKQVACGGQHTVFLMQDGTVRAVGHNDFGQCGLGNTANPQLEILEIPSLTGVKQISCGNYHTVFLMQDGTVKTVGDNRYGQCGQGNVTSPQLGVLEIPNLSNVDRLNDAVLWMATVFLHLFKNTLNKLQFGLIGQENKQFKYKIEYLDSNGEVIKIFKSQENLIDFIPNGGKIKIE